LGTLAYWGARAIRRGTLIQIHNVIEPNRSFAKAPDRRSRLQRRALRQRSHQLQKNPTALGFGTSLCCETASRACWNMGFSSRFYVVRTVQLWHSAIQHTLFAEVEMTDFLHSKSSSAFAKVKRINKIVLSPIEISLSSAPWFSLTRIMASSLVFIDGIGRECCATGGRPKRSCGRHRPVVGHQCLFTFLERATLAGGGAREACTAAAVS
jgi:hypothetical protein